MHQIGYGTNQNEVLMTLEYEDVISNQQSIAMYQILIQEQKTDTTWALYINESSHKVLATSRPKHN